MKLLLDQGLPRSTVAELAKRGVTAEHVADWGMAQSTDAEILDAAPQRQSVVVTMDADFHKLLAASHATSPSVIRIRIEGMKGDDLAAILVRVLAVAGAELRTGAVVSVTRTRIRLRRLPIGVNRP